MLSKRLKAIADFVEKDKVVFDVGSDHGLLPCFLVEEGICKKVYAGDIGAGPLEHAKENIKIHHLEDKVIPILSDGLDEANDDVEIVIISGMGYHTIRHILENCDVASYDYFILQSNKDVDLLRQYLSDRHFTIEDEKIVHDGFYYEIIRFSSVWHAEYNYQEIKYGPILLKNRDEVFIEFLEDKRRRLVEINKKAHSVEYAKTIKEIEEIVYNI